MTFLSNLSRHLAKPSTVRMLESISSLFQVIAIVGGACWAFWVYFDFQKVDSELSLKQKTLALERSTQDRLEAAMDSRIVKAVRYDDGTFLYRYYVSFKLKNITEVTVFVPAIAVEFFVGVMPKDEPAANKTLYINLPSQFQEKAVLGKISWSKEATFAHTQIDPLKKKEDAAIPAELESFSKLAVDFGGRLQPQESTDIGLTFLIRSRPESLVGTVITYWERTKDSLSEKHFHTNHELLVEAGDAPTIKKEMSDSNVPDRGEKPK